jgi:hypothetical protein
MLAFIHGAMEENDRGFRLRSNAFPNPRIVVLDLGQ